MQYLAATAKRLDLDNNLMALTDRAAPIIGTLRESIRILANGAFLCTYLAVEVN